MRTLKIRTEMQNRVELARMIFTYVQMVRRNKNRPDMAAVAAEREIQFAEELEQLERELAATTERELPLREAEVAR